MNEGARELEQHTEKREAKKQAIIVLRNTIWSFLALIVLMVVFFYLFSTHPLRWRDLYEHVEYLAPLAAGLLAGIGVLDRAVAEVRTESYEPHDVALYGASAILVAMGLAAHILKSFHDETGPKVLMISMAYVGCVWLVLLLLGFERWQRREWILFLVVWAYLNICIFSMTGVLERQAPSLEADHKVEISVR